MFSYGHWWAALADPSGHKKTKDHPHRLKKMSRLFRNFFYFLIPFCLVIASGLTFAQSAPVFSRVALPGYQPTLGGFYANPASFQSGINSQQFITSDANFSVQGSQGTKLATVPITVNASIPRLAASVGAFAIKALPYAGVAVALYDVICPLTGFCHDSAQPSGFSVENSAPDGWTVDNFGIKHAPATLPATSTTPAGAEACAWLYDGVGATGTTGSGGWCRNYSVGIPNCMVSTCSGSGINQGPYCCYASAPAGYTWNGGESTTASKTGAVPGDNTPVGGRDSTNSDRTALATNPVLNTPSVVSPLAAAGEPVPVDVPIISPVTLPTISSDHVNRDAAGNPTSTTTTSTSQQITPAPLPGDPLRVQTQEQTTVTTKDGGGTIISSSTTTTNIAQTPPAATIKFPDDYNREVTQKSVETTLKHIDNSEGKTLTVPDPAAIGAGVSAETQKSVDKIEGIKTSHDAMIALFNFFVWTPPAVACTNPIMSYKGFSTSPDICTPAGYIKDALGFFFALFGAWTIYGILFRK